MQIRWLALIRDVALVGLIFLGLSLFVAFPFVGIIADTFDLDDSARLVVSDILGLLSGLAAFFTIGLITIEDRSVHLVHVTCILLLLITPYLIYAGASFLDWIIQLALIVSTAAIGGWLASCFRPSRY